MNAVGDIGRFRRGKQIDEVRIVGVGIVGVDDVAARIDRVQRAGRIGAAGPEDCLQIVILLRGRQFQRGDGVVDEAGRSDPVQAVLRRLLAINPLVIGDVGGRQRDNRIGVGRRGGKTRRLVDQHRHVVPVGLILLLLAQLIFDQRILDLLLRLGAGQRQFAPDAILQLRRRARIDLQIDVDIGYAAVVDDNVGVAARGQREQLQIAGLLLDIDVAARAQRQLVVGGLADFELQRRAARADAARCRDRDRAALNQARAARRRYDGAVGLQRHRIVATSDNRGHRQSPGLLRRQIDRRHWWSGLSGPAPTPP